ncbi:hypothetical protein ACOZCG_19510 [Streptomyces pseudogriseolus]|uniref:hypothetical protein n=1 Tax=Streptomyces pseudogriseolus TaxID=36817 RepID=UPI003FA25E28
MPPGAVLFRAGGSGRALTVPPAAVLRAVAGVPREAADTAREGIANAVEVAPSTGGHASALVHAAQESFVEGWQRAMWAGVAVMAVLLVVVALRGPDGSRRATADGEEAAEATLTP